ncbi:4Fe-4S binding protein [Alkalithermobacter paradoxus]|uniref:Electron transport complex subunit RsxB n=1 Tax=Alkalithermobacter paradoxus TaxID=29349 RepID=A0A1V4I8M7_9FIRM|nr:electron transport complex subunit RsxB [[Clostridium] thermoalcaliphilum]
MKRNIIEINDSKCIGCGLCANACHQGAIQIINGKAKLVSDSYCDGLGMCLPACPVDAIKLIEKETEKFDESRRGFASKQNIGCPSSVNKVLKPISEEPSKVSPKLEMKSELRQWPVQLKLISPMADFWDGANLLISADCCAYAYANFHEDFIKGKLTVIGCPKLDDNEYYTEKLTEIFKTKDIKNITVVKMSVPCCQGIANAVKTAMLNAQMIVPYQEITISPDGKIV